MDGTTATTLAPSEEDMTRVTEVFAKMRDTVIDASKLAGEVAELRNSVGALRNELETLRERNRWADEQITTIRMQRDEAMAQRSEFSNDCAKARNERDELQRHCDNQRETLARLNEQVAQLRKERDDALFKVEELNEVGQTLQDKLDTIVGLVCPKEVVIGDSKPTSFVEQPRDPETQQFKSWEPARRDDEIPF